MNTLLKNMTRKTILAEAPRSALTFSQKACGLLGKKTMSRQEALFIPGCRSIHTFFMKFDIDVVFVNGDNKALKIVHNLKPFRLLWGPWEAKGVWELQAGALKDRLLPGDTVQMVEGMN
jgi:uncharacterized membrane protein (UPF0127 family)